MAPRDYIMVVDDDPVTRRVMAATLERAGYRVAGAGDGCAALELLRAGPRPCLIVLDLVMPGMDGWAFRAAQRHDAALQPIPVVVVSSEPDLAAQATALKAAGYLAKPVAPGRLVPLVQAAAAPGR